MADMNWFCMLTAFAKIHVVFLRHRGRMQSLGALTTEPAFILCSGFHNQAFSYLLNNVLASNRRNSIGGFPAFRRVPTGPDHDFQHRVNCFLFFLIYLLLVSYSVITPLTVEGVVNL